MPGIIYFIDRYILLHKNASIKAHKQFESVLCTKVSNQELQEIRNNLKLKNNVFNKIYLKTILYNLEAKMPHLYSLYFVYISSLFSKI